MFLSKKMLKVLARSAFDAGRRRGRDEKKGEMKYLSEVETNNFDEWWEKFKEDRNLT